MNQQRLELFDQWASQYDPANDLASFPFDGYNKVLDGIVQLAGLPETATVLDLGTGTANLAAKFVARGCEVWGLDFSNEMLREAKKSLPEAHFLQTDLLSDLPVELPESFDCIVSGYVFHEFSVQDKLLILTRVAKRLNPGGSILIGDIAFENSEKLEFAKQLHGSLWDDDEFYWTADEMVTVLEQAQFQIEYVQVSGCAGIFILTPSST